MGVSIGDLDSLEGELGECIFDGDELWILSQKLHLRFGWRPVALKNHPSIRTRFLLVTAESLASEFISESRARKERVTRGIKRYQLIESGFMVAQLHYKREAIEAAPLKADVASRKAKLVSNYPTLKLPADWERYSDKMYADHFRMLNLVQKEGWSWKPTEEIFEYDADAKFFRWMEQEGFSFTSPLTGQVCYRYATPWEALKMHEPVELIKALYPRSSAFLFRCACQPDFAGKAMLAAITS